MACIQELDEIIQLFDPTDSNLEDECCIRFGRVEEWCVDSVLREHEETEIDDNTVDRTVKGILSLVVGDCGTCRNNRAVVNHTLSSFDWCSPVPGDLHTKGYLCEACFKDQGQGGLHFLVNKVLDCPKLTKDAFKKKKFQDQNLNRIREAARDGTISYGIAAARCFFHSSTFPSKSDLSLCKRQNGNHNKILLSTFKSWLDNACDDDKQILYLSRKFTLYGPLLSLFEMATENGCRKTREAAYILQLPIYAQLNFKNYYTEVFVQ